MERITNTATADAHPEWLMGGAPHNIERQEAQGQAQLAKSSQLPTDVRGRDILEAAGVVFGEPSEGDPLFCDATLPEGWKVRPTEHPMWSDLIDAEGKVRAQIFYKAAFYDRRAAMHARESE